ncbi:Putative lipopolysaccharide biosynthesis protein [Ignavibacterium album JCM 16511]|uniref:Putative lipopolysaccharide biosynthesis protein n=1 Tax=Ignavibacterium album (strain DSM 19864 / JCM 16511 / NBRC 101810 / Mat9-16) TaxID=945713 RepID=I0ALD3_IGNAJ|nr:Wzz/FepE/Etk N-terminal domain-containing protein [Ignavibacterium album]AFH49790.1 Putative lipopolysaccharide biosynthesis protein [Ignavibacterium album JCM 16511]
MDFHTILHTILINWKRIISVTILSTVILFLILLFVYPVTYTSSVTILPPERKKDFGLGSLLGTGMNDLSGIATGMMTIASSEMYIQIMKSRTLSEFVVKKLDLVEKFNVDSDEKAIANLQKMISFDLNKEGIVKLSVDVTSNILPAVTSDKDSLKVLAKQIAQSFIDGLNYFNNSKLSTKSKNTRIYLEQQISETRVQLDSLENELVKFQQKYKTISLSDQMKTSLEAAAKLKSEITRIEIEMNLLKNDVTEENKYYHTLQKQLEELKKQYNKFDTDRIDYLLSFKNAPELGQQLSSLFREVRIQNEIYVMLQQLYYKEKIQEKRDTPSVDILDEPIIPENQSSPRLFFSSLIGGIFIFIGLSSFYFYKDLKVLKAKNSA